ncbi:alpha-latroinsectotoxin-Lt1a-like [Mytilus californianus]|uniref:alpha-latroinsectotoxin-Lt1a-like n=1 Tax=Mytilus californianus TaxID=6549 RepID=UPI002248445B|nr:alpha-latroinsectotoxin-Lt1a-like [Mytilus californianus]
MLIMFAFPILLILTVMCTTVSYHLQCPDISQRTLRASAYCLSSFRSEYTCLFDTNRLRFSEQCEKNQDYVTRGEKYVVTGRRRNVDCSSERYQPFPLWSNVSGVCLYQKTICKGEGQVLYNNGTLISDRACRCDYTKGYKFIKQPKQNCFCIPSAEDCSCYLNKCAVGFTLSPDYECVYEEHDNDSKCPALPASQNKRGSWQQINTRNNGKTIHKSYKTSYVNTVVAIGFVICPLLLLVIIIRGKVWEPYSYTLIPVLLLFAVLLTSFVLVLIFVKHCLKIVAIGATLLGVCIILGTVFVVYCAFTHQLVKYPRVYDEYYELQIYKLLLAASKGDIKMLRRIKYQNYINMNDTDCDKRSALHLAACEGYVDAVKYLLNNNNVYHKGTDRCLGQTPAEDANWHMTHTNTNTPKGNLDTIIWLLKKHTGLQKDRYHFKDIVAMEMIKAVESGDVTELQRRQDMKTDMNISDHDGRTALHAAVQWNQEKVIDFLIKCKVSPFVRWRGRRPEDIISEPDKNPNTSKNIANKLRNYMDRQLKLQSDEPKKENDYADDKDLKIVRILSSALRGDIRLMKQYKAVGYCMTVSDYDKRTALHIAVNNNQEHIVEFLLNDCGLTEEAYTAEDRWRKTPFQAAMKEGREHILKMFLDYCPNLPIPTNAKERKHCIVMACVHGDLERLKRYKAAECCMAVSVDDKRTALHIAVNNNQEHIVEYLLKECKLIEEADTAQDRSGITPFKAAMVGGRDHILQIFLKYCPDLPNPTTNEEIKNAIFMASKNGDVQRLKRYNQKGYNMKISDNGKETALHIAVNNNQEQVVEFLLKDCNLIDEADTAEDRWGETPFEAAKKEGRENILNIFTNNCPNLVNTTNDEKSTFSLLIAGEENDVNKLQRLYNGGGSINMQSSNGKTAWHVSADKWNINAMEYLTNINKSNDNKQKGVIITCKKEDMNLSQTDK